MQRNYACELDKTAFGAKLYVKEKQPLFKKICFYCEVIFILPDVVLYKQETKLNKRCL